MTPDEQKQAAWLATWLPWHKLHIIDYAERVKIYEAQQASIGLAQPK